MNELDASCSDVYLNAMPPYYLTTLSVFFFWLGLVVLKHSMWIFQPCISCIFGDAKKEEGSLGLVDYWMIFQLGLNLSAFVSTVIALFSYNASGWDRYQLLALTLSQTTFPAIALQTLIEINWSDDPEAAQEKFDNPQTSVEKRKAVFFLISAAILGPIWLTHTVPFIPVGCVIVGAVALVVACASLVVGAPVVCLVQCCLHDPESEFDITKVCNNLDHNDEEMNSTQKENMTALEAKVASCWSCFAGNLNLKGLQMSLFQLLSVQTYFGLAVPWVYLMYRGHPLLDIPSLDFNARTTECYFNTLSSNFQQQVQFAALW